MDQWTLPMQVEVLTRHVTEHNIRCAKFSAFEEDRLVTAGRDNIRMYRLRHEQLRGLSVRLTAPDKRVTSCVCPPNQCNHARQSRNVSHSRRCRLCIDAPTREARRPLLPVMNAGRGRQPPGNHMGPGVQVTSYAGGVLAVLGPNVFTDIAYESGAGIYHSDNRHVYVASASGAVFAVNYDK